MSVFWMVPARRVTTSGGGGILFSVVHALRRQVPSPGLRHPRDRATRAKVCSFMFDVTQLWEMECRDELHRAFDL